MKDRIKYLRKDLLKMSMEAFGGKIGLSKAAISSFESGKNGMSDMAVKSICREFGVSEIWIRSGVGNVFCDMSSEEELQRLADRIMVDTPDSFRRRFISVLAKLNDDQWAALAEISDMLAKENDERSLADLEKDAEEEYIKKSSGSARSTDTNVLNSTEDAM